MFRFLYILSLSVVSMSSSLDSLGQEEDKNGTHTSYTETAESFFPSLSAVLNSVEANAPILLQEREKVNEATANRMVADSKRGFRLSVGLNGHSLYEDRPNANYYQQYRYLASAYVRKPLYHWGALQAGSRMAELSESSSSASFSDFRRNFLDRIRVDYLELVLSTYEIELTRRSMELAESNLEGMKERMRLGLVTELSVSEAKIIVLQQRINFAEMKRKLARNTRIFMEDSGSVGGLDLTISDDFRDFAKTHRFGLNLPILASNTTSTALKNIDSAIEAENQRIIIAKSGLRPKLNLIGGFHQDKIDLADSRSSVDRNNFTIGLEANWALFDASQSRGEKRAAMARKRRYEIQLERETRHLQLEARSLREYLVTRAQTIDSSRQLLGASEDRFEKSRIEFDRNRITPDAFFSSRLALDQSRLSLIRTVVDYLNVRAQFNLHIEETH
jgi:outer membrane protein TolC